MTIFIFLFVVSSMMIIVENTLTNRQMTGFAVEGYATSNVTISKYLSISMSPNLTTGILFGTIDVLPAVDINASGNNNSDGGLSTFYINVSSDSNTPVDFCIKANTNFYDGGGANTLGAGNESFSNATSTTATSPTLVDQLPLTTGYVKAGFNSTRGQSVFYRFWLDVPSGTPSGSYNNTVNFKGVEVAAVCGS